MTKNKVNVSQISLLLLLVIAGGKFLTLPSVLAKDVGHDSWLVLCIAFLLDAVCLAFLLWAIKINENSLSLDTILDKTVGKVVSKPILAVFFVMFVCRVIVLLDSCYKTFAVTFDVNTNWVLFMLPIVALAGFSVHRGFNSVARVVQILFGLIIISVIALLVYPTTQADFGTLLPIGEAGFFKLVKTAFLRSFWFSDYVFAYFLLEDVKPQKRLFLPAFTCFGVGVVLTVLLNVVYVSLFGSFAAHDNLAMTKIGLFSVAQTTNGRWDWLTLTVWLTSVIIKIITFVYCAYKCVEKLFETSGKFNFFTLAFIAVLLLLPMFLPVETFVQTFVKWCLVPFCLVQYLLPLVMPLLTNRANKKVNAGVQNERS